MCEKLTNDKSHAAVQRALQVKNASCLGGQSPLLCKDRASAMAHRAVWKVACPTRLLYIVQTMQYEHQNGRPAPEDAEFKTAAVEVLLNGLSPLIDKTTLSKVLSRYGQVNSIALLPSGVFNSAVVTYASKRQAAKAVYGVNRSSVGIVSQIGEVSAGRLVTGHESEKALGV